MNDVLNGWAMVTNCAREAKYSCKVKMEGKLQQTLWAPIGLDRNHASDWPSDWLANPDTDTV